MTWRPNKTPYVMFFGGAFRPVTFLSCGRNETKDPTTATAAVLYLGPEAFMAVTVGPGDVVRRPKGLETIFEEPT